MPTAHKRIPVTKDEELAEALARVASPYPDVSPARLVHDLAIKGADAAIEQRRKRDESIECLIKLSTGRGDAIDWDVLERARETAWRRDQKP